MEDYMSVKKEQSRSRDKGDKEILQVLCDNFECKDKKDII